MHREQAKKYKVVKYRDRYGMIDMLQDCPSGGVFAHVCFSDTDASWYHQKDLEELSDVARHGEEPSQNEKLRYLNDIEGIMRNKFAELRSQASQISSPSADVTNPTTELDAARKD